MKNTYGYGLIDEVFFITLMGFFNSNAEKSYEIRMSSLEKTVSTLAWCRCLTSGTAEIFLICPSWSPQIELCIHR